VPLSTVTVDRVVAPTENGVVVVTYWESAEARDAYQSDPEHREALKSSGLLDAGPVDRVAERE
jgi:heme-degrading monooxygenase HmoA